MQKFENCCAPQHLPAFWSQRAGNQRPQREPSDFASNAYIRLITAKPVERFPASRPASFTPGISVALASKQTESGAFFEEPPRWHRHIEHTWEEEAAPAAREAVLCNEGRRVARKWKHRLVNHDEMLVLSEELHLACVLLTGRTGPQKNII